jgi:hypothetical protein
MEERKNQAKNLNENVPGTDYKSVIVYRKTIPLAEFEPDIQNRLSNIGDPIAIKGGFARELLRFNLGLSSQLNYEKLKDLDIVVFETPSPIREERIARRNQIASLSEQFEPKDIEVCDSTPEGIVHYFRTRDVTMNELVMFKDRNNLQFLYSQECLEDLKNRVIRPPVHLTHTGLGLVWIEQEGRKLLSAATIGRCIYRKVKGDGDVFESTEIDFYESAKALNTDELFKIVKRFAEMAELFESCMQVFQEIGINGEVILEVRKRIRDPKVKKSRGIITSEIVEDMLDERESDYKKWLQNADSKQKSAAEVIFT